MKKETQQKIILLVCMALMGIMWFSLANAIVSGRPFRLADKWYVAAEVKPSPAPQ